MLVMYSAFLRQSEVVNLRRADVSFTVEGAGSAQIQTAVLWVKVSHAKNDQRGLKPPRPALRSAIARCACVRRCVRT